MKRNKRPTHLGCISSVFPLFYKECAFCDMEFKLEHGRRYKDSLAPDSMWDGYVCYTCCTSKQELYRRLGDRYGCYRYPPTKTNK